VRTKKLIPAELGRAWSLVRATLAVVMLVGLTFAGPVVAQDGVTVSVGDYEVSRGDIFTVTLEIKDADDIAAYLVEVGFDPTVVEVQSVTAGDFLGADPWRAVTTFDNEAGTLKADVALEPPYPEGGVDGDGVLAEIVMKAVGRGISALNFTRATLQDGSGTILDPELDPGTVTSRAAMEVAPAHPEQVVALGSFTEMVMIRGGEDLAGYRFTLRSSNPAVVAIEDVELGPFLEENSELTAQFNKTVDPAGDEATVQVAGVPPGEEPVDGASGDGVIAIVHLNALAVGEAALTLDNRLTYDSDAVEEVPEALNGLVHVSDVEMSVKPEETLRFVGQTFEVDIHVDDGAEGLEGYRFTLAYAPTILRFVSVEDTGFLDGPVAANLTGPEDGEFTFQVAQVPPSGATPDGPGDLATITFEAVGEGTSELHFVSGEVGVPLLTPASTVDGEATAEICEEPEISALTATPNPAEVGETVQFDATVTGSEIPSEPMVRTWDFGDGSPTEEGSDSATHVYDAAGTYTATLTVDNWCGSAEREVVVEILPPCQAVDVLDILFDTPVKVNDEVQFTAVVTGTPPIGFSWDFDSDGTPEMEDIGLITASHTYTETGSYMVTVLAGNCSVTDPFTDTMTKPITVEAYMLFLPIIAKDYVP
jgi:PKD repeat protein